jgi:hypothetical protein
MQRLLQVLWMLVLFELGVLLLFLPWFTFWDSNYFLSHYPALRPYLLQPALRGTISGLGALDIFLAARMIRRRSADGETQHSSS